MRFVNPVTLLLILVGGAMVAFAVWYQPGPAPLEIESLASYQKADAPLLLPADGVPRHRLHQLGAWQLAMIPEAPRFDAPMGTASGGLTYNAQKFWEMNGARGGHHTGDDLNGIGGMNSDLGDPVHATADGLVVYAGNPSPGWGPTILVVHRLPDGDLLQSMYAHLERIDVATGTVVSRGQRIGRVGTAGGLYPAHLHFEIRRSRGADIGAGYSMVPLNRLDPEATVREHRGAPADRPAASAYAVALDRERAWNRLEIEGAEILSEILAE